LPRQLFGNGEGIAAALALKLDRHGVDSDPSGVVTWG
jgi:hypothetical protein